MARIIGTPESDSYNYNPNVGLIGTRGDDYINGLGGDDEMSGDAGDDVLLGSLGDDTIRGDEGFDSLSGGSGDDTLDGGDHSDILNGGTGDDVLVVRSRGEQGPDTLIGGSGEDVFYFDVDYDVGSTRRATSVIADFEGAGVAGGDSFNLLRSAAGYEYYGYLTGLSDHLPIAGDVLGVARDRFLETRYAYDGDDTILFQDSNDSGAYEADDLYIRVKGRQVFTDADFDGESFAQVGSLGDDVIAAVQPARESPYTYGNLVFARSGDDVVAGGDRRDQVDGGLGADTIDGGAGDDYLIGQQGDDLIHGGTGNDQIIGNRSYDEDDDTGSGGQTDNNLFHGDQGDDTIMAGSGFDTIYGGDGNDRLTGGYNGYGYENPNHLFGEAGGDFLTGSGGNDTLNGGAGNDGLEGARGADWLIGGTGDDRYRETLGSIYDSSSFPQVDTITNFQRAGKRGGDLLVLESEKKQAVFDGEVEVDLSLGAALPGGGNGLIDLFYTDAGKNTFVMADDNDNGVLDVTDLMVRVLGEEDFITSDFSGLIFI